MENKYESTRDSLVKADAKDAIVQGISKEGGLFVKPDLDSIQIDLDTIVQNTYKENAKYILGKLLNDFTEEELDACVENAYTNTFDDEEISPLKKVGDQYVMELFHGPTSAFKDVALTLLPQLLSTALKKNDQKALILTATSGDTGKAALSGFADVDNIGIVVFYPHEKVSQIQYKQMATQKGKNVAVYAVKGNFDDTQSEVKKLFLNEALNEKANEKNVVLSSANSINIGRLVPQVVYYFDAYRQLVQKGAIKNGDPVSFSVPTGNFGDVLAGYYAYLMGLPVKKFYVASNANNVLADFLTTGVYNRNRPFIKTISPSMDILISSNFERLLYYMSGKDNEKVAGWMKDLAEKGRYEVDSETLSKIQALFTGDYADDEKTRKTIKDVYEATGEVLDPHTAIGYAAALEKADKETPVICLATASPYKFAPDVLKALGEEADDEWAAMKKLRNLSSVEIPEGLAGLEEAKILHEGVLLVDEMEEAVSKAVSELL